MCFSIWLSTLFYSTQKLQEHEAIFNQLSYNEKDEEKWKKVLQVSFMSSEESKSEDVIEVRPMPWRSDRVTTYLHSLDEKARYRTSPQAKRQMTWGVKIISPETSRWRCWFSSQHLDVCNVQQLTMTLLRFWHYSVWIKLYLTQLHYAPAVLIITCNHHALLLHYHTVR